MMPQDPQIGRTIKGYRLVERLGEGGMGSVYRAEQPLIGKQVAVKLLHPHLAQDPEALARFLQEAKATNQINHDNIVDILDFERTEDGNYFLLMEYLAGRSLEVVLQKEAPLSLARIGKIGLQLCAGLHAAHQKGIIHRDLKAENVFLISHAGRSDFVKILDFGVAKYLEQTASSPKTRAGSFIGSPSCIAPEQAMGLEVDGRADLYALGVLLYSMAVGSPPFAHKDMLVLLSHHLAEPPPPPRVKNPKVSPALEALILGCLEKNRERRFASAKVVAQELARCCQMELVPYFLSEEPSVEPKTSPNITPPTKKLPTLDEPGPMLTPLANPPLTRRPPQDEFPTTQLPNSSPKIKAEARPEEPAPPEPPPAFTEKLSSITEAPSEEWKISQDHGAQEVRFDTMQQANPPQSPPEEEKAQAAQPTKQEDPVSLEELRRQDTVSGPSVKAKVLAEAAAEAFRAQMTVQVPALPKESEPSKEPEVGPEVFPIPPEVREASTVSLQDLQKQQTIDLPSGRSVTAALANLPQPSSAEDLPPLAKLPASAPAFPWWIFILVVALIGVALLWVR